jgi:aspartyl-tRNA(Asn)/glutamyl-tRNA(Gln) amidotransferase subunit C
MSTRIDQDQVRHVARLARLELTPEEVERFARELSDILDYVAQLEGLDTDAIEPTSHAVELRNVLRSDEPGGSLEPSAALRNAPSREQGFFQVPKVLDQGDALRARPSILAGALP